MIPRDEGRGPLDGPWSSDVRREIARSNSIAGSFGGYLVCCGSVLVILVGLHLTRSMTGGGHVAAMIGVLALAVAIPALFVALGRRR